MTTNSTDPVHAPTDGLTGERADLLESLRTHRALFRRTLEELGDDAARSRPTVSSLSLGGLVKHLTRGEREWASFVTDGPAPAPDVDWARVDWSDPPPAVQEYLAAFELAPDETLAEVLLAYDRAAAATDTLVATVDLDHAWPLPRAPWFVPGATRSNRRTFLHLVAETAQHAGHADLIRETIDGHRTMG